MALANLALCLSASADTVAWSLKNDVDVHTVDTDVWIVLLLREIRVVTNSEGEVSLRIEVPAWDGVVSYPEGVGQEFLDGILVTHGRAAPNRCSFTYLEVTVLDLSEGSLWANTGDHFENVLSIDQSVTTFTDTDVDANLRDSRNTHWIDCFAQAFTSIAGMLASPTAKTLTSVVPNSSNATSFGMLERLTMRSFMNAVSPTCVPPMR
jgi:hypothetical protein